MENEDSLYALIAELEARITILEKVCEELEGEIEELQDMYLKVDPKLKYFTHKQSHTLMAMALHAPTVATAPSVRGRCHRCERRSPCQPQP